MLLIMLTAAVSQADLSAPTQTPTIESANPNVFEGWIVKIEYNKNLFRLLDPRGFEKKINTKPGIIGDYRMGDHIRVEVDPVIKTAYTIEKLA
jgi:hypothetical protein